MSKKARSRTAGAAADVEQAVSDAALRAHEVPPFDAPVRICIASVRGRLADPDGISGKAAIDGLVACGILPTDTAEQVEQVTFTQRKGRRETTTIIIETSVADGLAARVAELEAVLRGYEKWEGELVLSQEAWRGGMAALPTLTQPLFDRLIELQTMRNKVLGEA